MNNYSVMGDGSVYYGGRQGWLSWRSEPKNSVLNRTKRCSPTTISNSPTFVLVSCLSPWCWVVDLTLEKKTRCFFGRPLTANPLKQGLLPQLNSTRHLCRWGWPRKKKPLFVLPLAWFSKQRKPENEVTLHVMVVKPTIECLRPFLLAPPSLLLQGKTKGFWNEAVLTFGIGGRGLTHRTSVERGFSTQLSESSNEEGTHAKAALRTEAPYGKGWVLPSFRVV